MARQPHAPSSDGQPAVEPWAAIAARVTPTAYAPPFPRNTLAVGQFQTRKPASAPASANGAAAGKPEAAVTAANPSDAIAPSPPAKPSCPSIMFTALARATV